MNHPNPVAKLGYRADDVGADANKVRGVKHNVQLVAANRIEQLAQFSGCDIGVCLDCEAHADIISPLDRGSKKRGERDQAVRPRVLPWSSGTTYNDAHEGPTKVCCFTGPAQKILESMRGAPTVQPKVAAPREHNRWVLEKCIPGQRPSGTFAVGKENDFVADRVKLMRRHFGDKLTDRPANHWILLAVANYTEEPVVGITIDPEEDAQIL
jgi:hypothetical protein